MISERDKQQTLEQLILEFCAELKQHSKERYQEAQRVGGSLNVKLLQQYDTYSEVASEIERRLKRFSAKNGIGNE
jgi:hypothetical protein